MSYTEDDMLMLSGIQHYAFCPRQWALIHIDQHWNENLLTTEGKILHQRVDDPFCRQKMGDYISLRSVQIASKELGLYILVTYDVQTETNEGQRRLRKVARLCMDYGQRVQNSVFECILTEVQLAELRNRLDSMIDKANDSIRIYYLNRNENRRIITIGQNDNIDVEGTLII